MYSTTEAAVCLTNCLSKDLHMLLNFHQISYFKQFMKNNK